MTEFGSLRYDGVGNRTAASFAVPSTAYSGSTAYAYDGRSELTGETSTRNGGYALSHAYDGAGNPTTFRNNPVGAANVDNQLPGVPYDGDGAPASCKGTTVTYDPEGRAVNFYGLVASGYNGDGLRGVKYAGGYTYFLYDGEQPVCELNSSGVVTAVHTFGPNGLLARGFGTNGGTNTFLYTWDLSGNLARRLDVNGNILGSALFDGFGAATSTDNSPDPFSGFGGQWGGYTDAAQAGQTGLTLLGHRFYDPSTERFLTRDPLGPAGGLDLYAYGGNNPVTLADPAGLSPGSPGSGPSGAGPGGWDPSDPDSPDPTGPVTMGNTLHPGMTPGTYQNGLAGGMNQGLQNTLVNAAVAVGTDGLGNVIEGAVDVGAAGEASSAGGGGGTTVIGRMDDLKQFDDIDGIHLAEVGKDAGT